MISRKIIRTIREAPIELSRLLRGHYPSFVSEFHPAQLVDEVPVFMFHQDDPVVLETQFAYLKQNGYRSLSLNEFMGFLSGTIRITPRSVLLTWDDGDSSWFTDVCPLLKKYGFCGIGFVVPAYIDDQPVKTSERRWLTWNELAEMDTSGLMDIQSHSHRHDRIFTGPEVFDFFHPGFDVNPLHLDIPWHWENGRYTNRLQLGTPLYRHSSRFEDRPMIKPDPEILARCMSYVDDRGGEQFFQQSGWRRELLTVYHLTIQKSFSFDTESHQEQETRILESLSLSRKILSQKLGKDVAHLCYPYGIGSRLAVRLSQRSGYISNFWVIPPGRRTSRAGDSPFYIPRIKNDYIFRLPGKGRKSLADIFSAKLRRRMQRIHIY
ncbi:MAG: polysaccharide deacetylase family protein [Desulfatirhabdiaceae bacterium]